MISVSRYRATPAWTLSILTMFQILSLQQGRHTPPPVCYGLGGRTGGGRHDLNLDVTPAGADVSVRNDGLRQTHESRDLRLKHADSGVVDTVVNELLFLKVVEAILQRSDLAVDAVVHINELLVDISLRLKDGVLLDETELIAADGLVLAGNGAAAAESSGESSTRL